MIVAASSVAGCNVLAAWKQTSIEVMNWSQRRQPVELTVRTPESDDREIWFGETFELAPTSDEGDRRVFDDAFDSKRGLFEIVYHRDRRQFYYSPHCPEDEGRSLTITIMSEGIDWDVGCDGRES